MKQWRSLSIFASYSTNLKLVYSTELGELYLGEIERSKILLKIKQVQADLIFTSPPYPLQRKKKYGNLQGTEYISWLIECVGIILPHLKEGGSMVMEIGNAWDAGQATMSLLPLQSLIAIAEAHKLCVCQQFIWYNPAKLPSPAQWVNVERSRVKDSYTHIWWFSKTPNPKANNKRVLVPYSKAMQNLLKRQSYNSGLRPSEHHIGKTSFLQDHGGAIPSNVLTIGNTHNDPEYQTYCQNNRLPIHPARMPSQIADFFISMLTDNGDLIFDPFSGSNVTGKAAERLERRWLSFEKNEKYAIGSKGRFL